MPEADAHVYESHFFDYIEEGSDRSAGIVVPMIHRLLGSASVLDVGCGRGVWLSRWMAAGVADVAGVDGSYVAKGRLAIPADRFVAHDLSRPFSLGRRFDLVQSLEVAEHIGERRADTFVVNLAAHSDVVLFSAAVPGQGGEMHVNEQPYGYWQDKFAAHGFRMFDWLRPRLSGLGAVEPWYRYNAFLFAHDRILAALPRELRQTELAAGHPVPDFAPLTWRLRNRVLRLLPQEAVHQLAGLKRKLILMRRHAAHR